MKIIGRVSDDVKKLLNINTKVKNIIMSEGFLKHLEKRNHNNMYPYLKDLQKIIENPDYIGVNPREKAITLEYVKILEDNILVGVKIDYKNDYFYTATMHEISNLKLKQRINNGRLKKFDKK